MNFVRSIAATCSSIAILLVFTGAKVVDTYSYNLKGKVSDVSGNNVPGAKVAATCNNIELGATTSLEDGSYDLKFETVKEYTGRDMLFIVSRDGFQKKTVPNVPIFANEPLIVNFKIQRDYKSFRPDKDAELYRTSEFIEQIEAERW